MNTENRQNEQLITETEQTKPNKVVLEINSDISSSLLQTGKWSKFLAIVGFIGVGFMVFVGFVMSIVMSIIPSSEVPFPIHPALLGLFYLLMAVLYFFPVLYLFHFSTKIQKALFQKNQIRLTEAFNHLRRHYKFIGILMIVLLCLYPIMIVGMVIFSMYSGLSGMANFPV